MKGLVAFMTAMSLAAAPAHAGIRDAAFESSADARGARTSVFAGATYRIGLDRRASDARGRASLKVSGMNWTPGSPELRLGDGLEIAGGKTGRPALHLAGQDIGRLEGKANISGRTVAVIVVGVLVVGAIAAAVIIHEVNKCEEDCD